MIDWVTRKDNQQGVGVWQRLLLLTFLWVHVGSAKGGTTATTPPLTPSRIRRVSAIRLRILSIPLELSLVANEKRGKTYTPHPRTGLHHRLLHQCLHSPPHLRPSYRIRELYP